MWRQLGLVAASIVAIQLACAWAGPHTVLCFTTGVCMPSFLCMSCAQHVESLHNMVAVYEAMGSTYLLARRSGPVLTCLKQRLRNVPDHTPFQTVVRLETNALTLSTNANMFRSTLETKVVRSIQHLAAFLADHTNFIHSVYNATCHESLECLTAINATLRTLQTQGIQHCTDASAHVIHHATLATELSMMLRDLGQNMAEFSVELETQWEPAFRNYKTRVIPPVTRAAIYIASLGVGVSLVPQALLATVSGTILTSCGIIAPAAYFMETYDREWKQYETQVRETARFLPPTTQQFYSTCQDIEAAASTFDDVSRELTGLQGILESTTLHLTQNTSLSTVLDWTHDISRKANHLLSASDFFMDRIVSDRRRVIASVQDMHAVTTQCH